MSELPNGWIKIKLGDLCKMTSGGTPSRKNPSFYIGNIPWVKSGELDYNVIAETEEHISEVALNNSSAKIFPKGTLLIALYGATIGKLAFLGIDAATNQAVCGIFQNPAFSSKFLFYKLFFERPKLVEKGIGGAQPNISQTILKDTDVFLPPLPEQHRIVAKIEELFSELDNGIANLEKAKAQLKVYRQAVLKSAFEGKLTEQWRTGQMGATEGSPVPNNHEAGTGTLPSAEDLLARIQEERQNHYEQQLTEWREAVTEWEANDKEGRKPSKPKKPKEYPPLTAKELGELPELPVGWKWVLTGNVIDPINNGYTPKAEFFSNGKGEIPFIKVYNLTFDGTHNFRKDPTFIPDHIHRNELKRSITYPGDVLINIVGPPLGKVSIVSPKHPEWNINQAIVLFRPNEVIQSKYIGYYMQNPHTIVWLENTSKATAGQYNVKVSTCREIPFPLCSKEEQDLLIQEIESRLSVCDHLEQEIEKALQKSEALRQSILKKAFEGRLVPQDPAEEPAEVLLERIKAEKVK